jgi:hypothetical protein
MVRMGENGAVRACRHTALAPITLLLVKPDQFPLIIHKQGARRACLDARCIRVLSADVSLERAVPFRLLHAEVGLQGIEHPLPGAGADQLADLTAHTLVRIKGDVSQNDPLETLRPNVVYMGENPPESPFYAKGDF